MPLAKSRRPLNPRAPSRTLRARRSTRRKKHSLRYMWFPRQPIETPCTLSPISTSNAIIDRGAGQPGRALLSGGRGRRFKSSHPDHDFLPMNLLRFFVFVFVVWLFFGFVFCLLCLCCFVFFAVCFVVVLVCCVFCGLF